jgi:hypothetical protein
MNERSLECVICWDGAGCYLKLASTCRGVGGVNVDIEGVL